MNCSKCGCVLYDSDPIEEITNLDNGLTSMVCQNCFSDIMKQSGFGDGLYV